MPSTKRRNRRFILYYINTNIYTINMDQNKYTERRIYNKVQMATCVAATNPKLLIHIIITSLRLLLWQHFLIYIQFWSLWRIQSMLFILLFAAAILVILVITSSMLTLMKPYGRFRELESTCQTLNLHVTGGSDDNSILSMGNGYSSLIRGFGASTFSVLWEW